MNDEETVRDLRDIEMVEGPVRLSTSADGKVTVFWNVDYLSGTGQEAWGFLLLDGPVGLRSEPSISHEVFERCLYVINQRLQGLFIDGALIHRAHANGAHSCIAGRGTAARQSNIAYVETGGTDAQHAILCVGPAHDFETLTTYAVAEAEKLTDLVAGSQDQISPNRQRAIASVSLFEDLRSRINSFTREATPASNEYREVEVITESDAIDDRQAFRAHGLAYRDWIAPGSPLSPIQRRILLSSAIEQHPLRIVGPGGSGKTLLMQLLALRRLQLAKEHDVPIRIMYIVHNAAMAQLVENRFQVLEDAPPLNDPLRELHITTLSEYGRTQLDLDYSAVIDTDAFEAKRFQLHEVSEAVRYAMDMLPSYVDRSRLFSALRSNADLMPVVAQLVMAEISSAIKGHGLDIDKKRYILSERQLSRFHGILTQEERELVYFAFERYHRVVFEEYEVLDTDDIALSLLGRLRTPIWELKRRKAGFDYIFVDEAQLFNENERRVLPLLTNGMSAHVPIVLALDEAQDIYGHSAAGLATLGIPDIANENLASIHRSTRAIIRLAFYVIQRSTDLFGPDFPDFTGLAEHMEPDTHPLAELPSIEMASDITRFGKSLVRRIRDLRKANIRRIAVICHADAYWDMLLEELRNTDLPLHVLLQRGERLHADAPVVVLSKPPFVGGQEFDAVILIGLEQGVVPPRVPNNEALAAAVEQQTLREMYLSITRARFRLIALLPAGSSPTAVLRDALNVGLMHAQASRSTD